MITLLLIENLRSARGYALATAFVLGGSALLDGGGGLFTWDPASTADDDGVYVVKFAREDTGRWIRVQPVGCVLQSPNGHFWRVTVANDGTVGADDLGTTLPEDGG